jgi:hypothetical protein
LELTTNQFQAAPTSPYSPSRVLESIFVSHAFGQGDDGISSSNTLESFRGASRHVMHLFTTFKTRSVRTVGLQMGTAVQTLLVFTGIYNDVSSCNIVADVYALSLTLEIKQKHRELNDIQVSLSKTIFLSWDPSVMSF